MHPNTAVPKYCGVCSFAEKACNRCGRVIFLLARTIDEWISKPFFVQYVTSINPPLQGNSNGFQGRILYRDIWFGDIFNDYVGYREHDWETYPKRLNASDPEFLVKLKEHMDAFVSTLPEVLK